MHLADKETPTQVIQSTVIMTGDFQTVEQCSSKMACETHAFLLEEFDSPLDENDYFLLVNNIKCFVAKMYSTEPGALVHNKKLLRYQRNFRIDKVLDNQWDGFDEDLHCFGSFVAWKLDHTILYEEEDVSKE